MSEDLPMRALFIGVSLFVVMITITAVLTFYNTAKLSVQQVGTGPDSAELYRRDIHETLLSTGANNTVKGTQIINLLNYFYEDPTIHIVIQNLKNLVNGSTQNFGDVTQSVNSNKNLYEKALKAINPNQEFTLTKNQDAQSILHIYLIGK